MTHHYDDRPASQSINQNYTQIQSFTQIAEEMFSLQTVASIQNDGRQNDVEEDFRIKRRLGRNVTRAGALSFGDQFT